MKTKTLFILKSVLLTLCFLFTGKQAKSQRMYFYHKQNFGAAASASISGDGYGSQFSPQLYFKDGRKTYFFGPIIQRQKMNISGIRFNYDYTIVGEDVHKNKPDCKNLELFCFINASYQNQALLGKRALWEERMANEGYEGDVCKLRFKSIEAFGGFGLKLKLTKNLKWINAVGLGGYVSFDFPDHLYYRSNNAGLLLKTGLSYDFRK